MDVLKKTILKQKTREKEREREREGGREGRRENIETEAASIHPLVNVNHESMFHGTN
jgi:hypothetical protein